MIRHKIIYKNCNTLKHPKNYHDIIAWNDINITIKFYVNG